jgi:hypothetical protein
VQSQFLKIEAAVLARSKPSSRIEEYGRSHHAWSDSAGQRNGTETRAGHSMFGSSKHSTWRQDAVLAQQRKRNRTRGAHRVI